MLIDLSVPLNSKTPVYPGDPEIKIKQAGILAKVGWNDHNVSFNTHVSTHIDAPLHMIKDGKSLDKYPLDRFIGHGRYIKVRNYSFSFDDVKNAGIKQGDIVVFNTGLSSKYYDPSYFEDYPDMPEEIAMFLVEQGVSMVGLDMCSPDHEPFPIHKILLGGDVLIIENLSNLERLRDKEFNIFALPIKLDIDGAPARVIASLV